MNSNQQALLSVADVSNQKIFLNEEVFACAMPLDEKVKSELNSIPQDITENYIKRIGSLVLIENTPTSHPWYSSYGDAVKMCKDWLTKAQQEFFDELQKREIVVTHEEVMEYVIEKAISIYKGLNNEADAVLSEEFLKELGEPPAGSWEEIHQLFRENREKVLRTTIETLLRNKF